MYTEEANTLLELIVQILPAASFLVCYFFILFKKSKTENSHHKLALEPIKHSTKTKRKNTTLTWLSPLAFLSIWHFLWYLNIIPQKTTASPIETLISWWNLLISGVLIAETWISITRIIIGFGLAGVVGVALGIFAGSYKSVKIVLLPTNSLLRYIPPTAFVSLMIVYFGIGEMHKYAVIFLGVLFFLIQMVADIVDDIDRRYIEMGRLDGLNRIGLLKKVIIPWSMPRIVDALRINLGAAWTFLVAAEIIGSSGGLGHLLAISQRFNRIEDLYACILTFGIIGIISDRLIDYASKSYFRWYYLHLKQ